MSEKVFDRISQAYKGELGKRLMTDTKKRIDWICENIVGETMLDVGCSQGITSIILANEGKYVVGIDSEISRIEYAEEEKRNAQISDNLNFICSDFLTYDFKSRFDTVIMGEILEHVFDPKLFLNRARNLLKEKGRLIVTVQFGINPFPDHKRTYYFLELFEQINEKICVVDVAFFGNWIGFIADIDQKNTCIDIDERLIQNLENSFYTVDARKQEAIDNITNLHKISSKKLESAEETINELKNRIEDITNSYEASNKKIEEYASLFQEKEKAAHNSGIELISLKAELEKCKDNISEKEKTLSEVSKALEEAKERIYNLKYENRIQKYSLKTSQNERSENAKKIDNLNNELEEIKEKLNELELTVEDKDKKILSTEDDMDKLVIMLKDKEAQVQRLKSEIEQYHVSSDECNNLKEELRITKAGIETRNKRIKEAEEKLKSHLKQHDLLKKRFEEYNTLLYQSKKLNVAYERFPDIKLYNWARKLKNKNKNDKNANIAESKNATKVETSVKEDTEKYDVLFSDFIIAEDKKSIEKLEFKIRDDCKELKALKVACIMDDFTFNCFSPECDLLPLTPDNWEEEIKKFMPDMLFVESAWQGNSGKWHGMIVKVKPEFCALTEYCHKNGIPVAFWNKEDPGHNEGFMAAAGLCDFVFTTEVDCVAQYKRSIGHDRVYFLHFAAQPKLHNPVETFERKDMFCFAGAYYTNYPNRTKSFENLAHYAMRTKGIDIYDRNHDNPKSEHQFPEYYKPFILGSLEPNEIDRAYKGYTYNINANSGTWTQTMFARRAFELMASNTVVVGNFSRGLRTLFGNMAITTDNAEEAAKCLEKYCSSDVDMHRYRLQSYRKVSQEDLYEDRLDYIVQKVFGVSLKKALPEVTVVSIVENDEQLRKLQEMVRNQTYSNVKVFIEAAYDYDGNDENVLPKGVGISEFIKKDINDGFVAYFDAADFYGENYIMDMMLMLRYGKYDVVGKSSYYNEKENLIVEERPYHNVYSLKVRRAIFTYDIAKNIEFISDAYIYGDGLAMVSIHEFDYVENGNKLTDKSSATIQIMDRGIAYEEIEKNAENIKLDNGEAGYAIDLTRFFKTGTYGGKVDVSEKNKSLTIASALDEGKHTYVYAKEIIKLDVGTANSMWLIFEGQTGTDVMMAMICHDANMKLLGTVYVSSGLSKKAEFPANTKYIKLALRVKGSGKIQIGKLKISKSEINYRNLFLSKSNVLVLTNIYPAYDDLYRNAFVHQRVMEYKKNGMNVDVMCFNRINKPGYREFEGVDVVNGFRTELEEILEAGNIDTVCVHFLDQDMWEVLKKFKNKIRILVWCHGAEIQPWWRREFNYVSDEELKQAKILSEERMEFWKDVFNDAETFNLHFIFVSEYFKNEIFEDYNINLSSNMYSIIHNYINTKLFCYEPKDADARVRILSIRPFGSRNYANDLTVECIKALSHKEYFEELQFHIIGRGILFESLMEELSDFKNVIAENRFLHQSEIAELHKANGIFLVPTRLDSQGVSRDEAMSSGLVPVTNAVTAIPEFVDDSCGILAPGEDYLEMAKGIESLYRDPEKFLKMSEAAATRVRVQSSLKYTIFRELKLIAGEN